MCHLAVLELEIRGPIVSIPQEVENFLVLHQTCSESPRVHGGACEICCCGPGGGTLGLSHLGVSIRVVLGSDDGAGICGGGHASSNSVIYPAPGRGVQQWGGGGGVQISTHLHLIQVLFRLYLRASLNPSIAKFSSFTL